MGILSDRANAAPSSQDSGLGDGERPCFPCKAFPQSHRDHKGAFSVSSASLWFNRLMKYALLILALTTSALAVPPPFAPDRKEGEGPWTRLIIRGVTLVDGTGAPPIGPV